jgi:hypothetical protein
MPIVAIASVHLWVGFTKITTTMTISLPESMQTYVTETVAQGGQARPANTFASSFETTKSEPPENDSNRR